MRPKRKRVHGPTTKVTTIGSWSLCNSSWPSGGSYYFLQHECPYTTSSGLRELYLDTRVFYKSFHRPCPTCKTAPPEGIQALYVLITGDMK